MIQKYIQELLKDHNRVILPDFGAFLVRATSKHKDSNDLSLKLPDVYFSPFLKFNDELLLKFIVEKEKISKEEATTKIKTFIDDVKKVLDEDKPYKFENFGEFVTDKQGKVQFNPLLSDKKVEVKAEKPKEETKPVAKAEKPKTEAVKVKASVAKETPKKDEVKPKPAETTKVEKKDVKKDETLKVEAVKTPEPKVVPKPTTPIRKYGQKEPLNKGLIWTIAISVPLAVLLVFFSLNFEKFFGDEESTVKPTPKAKQEKIAQKPTKGTKKDTAKEQEVAETKQEKPQVAETKKPPVQQTTTKGQKKYYVIAGSFRNEKYANSYMSDLKQKGYSAEKLPERDGMHAVSYSSFTNKQQALAELNSLTKDKGLTAWLLYY